MSCVFAAKNNRRAGKGQRLIGVWKQFMSTFSYNSFVKPQKRFMMIEENIITLVAPEKNKIRKQ